jgi:16S rRNA (guanine1516-N2)-methyltransferase
MNKIILFAESEQFEDRASALSEHLHTEMTTDPGRITAETLYLSVGEEGLSLRQGDLALQADLTKMIPRVKGLMWQHEPLARAVKLKNLPERPLAIDATAGFGEDSMILAAAGYHVTLFEQNPIIAALLQDGLERAKEVPELAEIVTRMTFREGDSIAYMKELAGAESGETSNGENPFWGNSVEARDGGDFFRTRSIDVIYLDPMFPARKKTGLIKKKFQLLQQLEAPADDEEELLAAAQDLRPGRIVIKRPAKGPCIAGIKPDFTYNGNSIRYDCFSYQ